ncbi:MAG: branched-chain amino acid ABC transporter permease [Minwuia sp.]|uniref:branched-chain amino acid ABC transporter permease n=1 Tax=Minwuia sp. TaxID=2493630 RepID=UPI003A85CE41
MRFVFRTRYEQDLRLWRHRGDLIAYGLLGIVLVLFPFVAGSYYVGEANLWLIYSVAALGLMIGIGFTGMVSLGHSAFLGIGAYAHAYFMQEGVPFLVSLPLGALLAGIMGVVVGRPTLRMHGIYLAIATLAFALITQEVMSKWSAVTGGFDGLPVAAPKFLSIQANEIYGGEWFAVGGVHVGWAELWDPSSLYFICLFVLAISALLAKNLLRSPTGRAFVAIRNSEISAQSMGIHLAQYKTTAFGISAFVTGLAGGLFAHQITHLAPDAFNIFLSIELLLICVVGGIGTIQGAMLGALFLIALRSFIPIARDGVTAWFGDAEMLSGIVRFVNAPGLEAGLFGLLLVLFIIFEPFGLYGRWLKVKTYFDLFPLYKKATFARQKSYVKTERLR